MRNKIGILLLGGLGFILCVTLMAGCAANSNNTVTSSSSFQSTTTTQQSQIPALPSQQTGNVSSTQSVTVNLPSFADLLNVAEHSVVKIDITGTTTSAFGRTIQQQGAGSGWIMDAGGTIVTNEHVIEGANTITVTTIDGKQYPAQVINSDAVNDIALIKITGTGLQSIKIGDASKLRSGDWVLAIGNPLGEGIIATQGIVSRMGVSVQVTATQTYNDLIETTAAINPGNSGGPLINLSGEVIGITSLGMSGYGVQGMGYAISMVDALPVIQKLSGK